MHSRYFWFGMEQIAVGHPVSNSPQPPLIWMGCTCMQVSLMEENGSTRDDLKLPSGTEEAEKLAVTLKAEFAEGKEIVVSVLKVSHRFSNHVFGYMHSVCIHVEHFATMRSKGRNACLLGVQGTDARLGTVLHAAHE